MANQFIYITKDGDVLDEIVNSYYGKNAIPLPYVYNANPGLADLGPVYAALIPIILPDLPADVATLTVIKPWD